MNDVFSSDDLDTTPNFGTVLEPKDLAFKIISHEQYYENSIFLNASADAEMLILEGNTETLLGGNNSVNLLDGNDFSISIENGYHDIIPINGSINLQQNNGHSLLYIEDFSKTSGLIKIESGSVTIVNADSSNVFGEPSIENGFLFIGDSKTNYSIETGDQAKVEVLFHDVSQSAPEALMLSSNASRAPSLEISTLSTDTLSASSEVSVDTPSYESEIPEIFSENSIDITDYLDDYKVLNADIDTHFVGAPSFDAEVANIIDDIQQNMLELEKETNNEETAETQNSEVTLEAIIEISDYVDLEWQDAIEIISDV